MRPNGTSIPQAGCIQAAFVRYQRRLDNTRILASLSLCESATVLRTRSPTAEQHEEIGYAHSAVAVEVGRTFRA